MWSQFCNIACRHQSLINLDLSSNQLDERFNGHDPTRLCEILFQELSSSESKVQALNLSHNYLGANSNFHHIAISINNMLSNNTSLRILNLSSNPSLEIEQISRAIGLNRYIKTLDISRTNFTDGHDVDEFHNALKINTSLVELDLSHNGFDGNMIRSISNALMSNCTLEVLGLSNLHSIGELSEVVYLAEILKTHPSIKFIYLENSSIQPDKLFSLASSLQENNNVGICVDFFLFRHLKEDFVASMNVFEKHPNLNVTMGGRSFHVGLRSKVQEQGFWNGFIVSHFGSSMNKKFSIFCRHLEVAFY